MPRVLLAILALLGLVAQAAPAQARVGCADVAQVGVLAPHRAMSAALASGTLAAVQAAPGISPRHEPRRTAISARPATQPVATVLIGIDRARQ